MSLEGRVRQTAGHVLLSMHPATTAAPSPAAQQSHAPVRGAALPLRIAIADDHAVVRAGYRRLLELDARMQIVAEFGDGESAYRWLSSNEADVLILDLGMPGQGGLATLQRLQRRVPSLRVLIFTMHESADLAAQTLRAGAAGYITKSSAPESLVAAVHAVIAGEQAVSPDIARMLDQSNHPADALHEALSPREFEIFLLLATGHGVEKIATTRCLSAKTIANYQTTIRQKTGLGSSLEMYHYAEAHGLLPPSQENLG
jgi:DNA-binding NarL/FixJ family response regulator